MASQRMYQQLLSGFIEQVANALIARASLENKLLEALEQQTLCIKLSELDFPLCLTISDKQLVVSNITERVDCTISTSLSSLQLLQKEQQLTELIKQDKLDIDGDIKVAQRFASIAQSISFDWPTELSKYIGDVPTYKLEQFHVWLSKKFNFAKQQIESDASEWLTHEAQLLVTLPEISQFSQQVQEAKSAISALEARINNMTEQVHSKNIPESKPHE